MDFQPFPDPNSMFLELVYFAATGVFSNSCLISHSLAWEDRELGSRSEDAVPWGGGSPPSLEDAAPGPRASVLGALLQKTRSSLKYNTHGESLYLAVDCSRANKRTSRDGHQHARPLAASLASPGRSAGRRLGQGLRVPSS